jgi:hypothetical protein
MAVLLVAIGVITWVVVGGGGRAATTLSACSLLSTTQERALLDTPDVRASGGSAPGMPHGSTGCAVVKWPFTVSNGQFPPWLQLQLGPRPSRSQDLLSRVAGTTQVTIHGQAAWLVPLGSNVQPNYHGGPITGVSTYVLYAFKDGYEVKVQAFRTADTEATDKTAMDEMLATL